MTTAACLGNLLLRHHNLDAEQGLRVVGLATKTFTRSPQADGVTRDDESAMLFRGFLAFLDPPKESAIPCIKELYQRGIAIKVQDVGILGGSLCGVWGYFSYTQGFIFL